MRQTVTLSSRAAALNFHVGQRVTTVLDDGLRDDSIVVGVDHEHAVLRLRDASWWRRLWYWLRRKVRR